MGSEFLLAALVSVSLSAAPVALVGSGVGNADTFMSEGTKLYNQKKFGPASESFLSASRANPALLNAYLQLARSYTANKEVMRSCYAYRVYLKASPETPDRKKAQAESEQCERALKSAKGQPPDPTQRFVEVRAAFYAALDKKELLGKDGAEAQLQALVKEGFLGPELGEMAAKLGVAALGLAEEIHKAAMANEHVPTERLRAARPLYQVAGEVSVNLPDPSMMFIDGLAALQDKDYITAEKLFSEAAHDDATNKDYVFYRAVALVQGGQRHKALEVMEANLKDDPRTQVLRLAMALGQGNDSGAAELERLLFTTRYPPEK
jgi:tetratricopeptide (TPR) repeat protein